MNSCENIPIFHLHHHHPQQQQQQQQRVAASGAARLTHVPVTWTEREGRDLYADTFFFFARRLPPFPCLCVLFWASFFLLGFCSLLFVSVCFVSCLSVLISEARVVVVGGGAGGVELALSMQFRLKHLYEQAGRDPDTVVVAIVNRAEQVLSSHNR